MYLPRVLATYWRAIRPPTRDVVIAAAFVVFGQLVTWGSLMGTVGHTGPRLPNAILNLAFMSALAWRRRAPLAAVCWAVGVYFLSLPVFAHDMTFFAGAVPLIVLTASAGYHCDRRRAAIAAAVAFLGLVTVTFTVDELRSPDAFVWNALVVFVPWTGARSLRERGDHATALASTLADERAAREAALREVVESERARIARELHDIVAHSVAVMVLQVGAARLQLPVGAGAEAPLLAAENVGREALADLRRLLDVLRADDTDLEVASGEARPPQPGLSQLEALVTQVGAPGMNVELHVEGEAVELPSGLEVTAYRIVQEALTNVLKHSGAAKATVSLDYRPSSLFLEVTDDGTRAPVDAAHGHGLIGIAERASLFGGTADAGPGPTGGWLVRAEFPLPGPAIQGHPSEVVPAP